MNAKQKIQALLIIFPMVLLTVAGVEGVSLWHDNLSDGNGWNGHASYWETIQFADVNGDGRADVCARGTNGIYCSVSYGIPVSLWSQQFDFSDSDGWNGHASYWETIQFADVNGDGRADVCGRKADGIYCALSNGTGFDLATPWAIAFSDDNGWQEESYSGTIQFADVNGDRMADLCARGSAGIYVCLSTGSSFTTPTTPWATAFSDDNGWQEEPYSGTIQFPDLNGDGNADVCARGYYGICYALSTGSAFSAVQTWDVAFGDADGWHTEPSHWKTIQFADLNGDGMADVAGRDDDGLYCALFNGRTFDLAMRWSSAFSDANEWNTHPSYWSTIQLADINGDGNADVCGRGRAGVNYAISEGSFFQGEEFQNAVRLTLLTCSSTEDSSYDDCELRISVDGGSAIRLQRDMRVGQGWAVNRQYNFQHSVGIELWDVDSGPDPDDHLGWTRVTTVNGSGTFSARFTLDDDADYTLTYEVVAVATMTPQERAHAALERFALSNRGSVFAAISKGSLINGISERIDNPCVMDQGTQSLCGPIAILVALAENDPERYVQMAQSIYETGRYGAIEPSSHLYTTPPPTDLAQVDWMLAASMRDAENWLFDFDPGDQLAGITEPGEMEDWMQFLLGCGRTEDQTAYVWMPWDDEQAVLAIAREAINDGHIAALLVDSDWLPGRDPGLNISDHWVLLLNVDYISDQRVRFSIQTWGERRNLDMDDETFEDLFFGAVIGYNGVSSAPAIPTPDALKVNVGTHQPSAGRPTVSKLDQNYPNPFNPETWIPYQLAQDTDVSIRIYTSSGQLVRNLFLGFKPSGCYLDRSRAAYWDGKNDVGEKVSSGPYFYRIKSEGFTAMRKMLVVK